MEPSCWRPSSASSRPLRPPTWCVDNLGAWKSRLGSPRDLCSAGCSLLTVGPTGLAYACPITCGDPAFAAGDTRTTPLATIWDESPALALVRQSSARDRVACAACAVVDACGGECWVQAHYAARVASQPAGLTAPFPYCELVRPVFADLLAAEHPTRLLKNDASPPGRDGRVRDKDAGSARSSATRATEDAVSRRPVRSGGQGFDFQQPPRPAAGGGRPAAVMPEQTPDLTPFECI